MSQRSVRKDKRKPVFNGQVLNSAALTQIVCFAIVASVAVIGFIQTRRVVYQLGEKTASFRQSEKYAGGESEVVSEVPSDAVSENEVNSVSDVSSSLETSSGTEKKTTTRNKTVKTTKTSKSKTTSRKTVPSTNKDHSHEAMIRINVSPVNVRSGAGTEFEVIGRTARGKVYALVSKDRDSDGKIWYQVSREDGKTGWIMASCCSEVNDSPRETASSDTSKKTTTTAKTAEKTTQSTAPDNDGTQVKITVSPVNIRSGAGTGFSVIGRTSRGRVFRLISTKKDPDNREWCEVALKDGKTGWIMASCCKRIDDSDREKSTESKVTSSTKKGKTSRSTTQKTTVKSATASKSTTKTTTKTTIKTTTKTTTASSAAKDKLIMKLQPDDRSAKYFIVVYIGSQSTVVYKKDSSDNYTKQVKVFTCSTGKKSSPTRTGKYHIRAKYRWRWLVGNVYGQYNSSISDDYLFHSVPYLKKDFSTLEDDEYDKLGKPASKGCIRMCVRDCKWIYDKCDVGTQVRIVSDSGPDGPGVPKRKTNSKYSGWDPSDKWADGNPYFA